MFSSVPYPLHEALTKGCVTLCHCAHAVGLTFHRVRSDLQGRRRRFRCYGLHWLLRQIDPHSNVSYTTDSCRAPTYMTSRNNILVCVFCQSVRHRLLICFTVVGHRLVLYTTSFQELFCSTSDYAVAMSCLTALREIVPETIPNPE